MSIGIEFGQQASIEIITCDGSRLELPAPGFRGPIREKLYPAVLDEEESDPDRPGLLRKKLYSIFDRRSFRFGARVPFIPLGEKITRVRVACPVGEWEPEGKFQVRPGIAVKGRCKVSQIAIEFFHPEDQKAELIKRCKTGQLSKKRFSAIQRILRLVSEKRGRR